MRTKVRIEAEGEREREEGRQHTQMNGDFRSLA